MGCRCGTITQHHHAGSLALGAVWVHASPVCRPRSCVLPQILCAAPDAWCKAAGPLAPPPAIFDLLHCTDHASEFFFHTSNLTLVGETTGQHHRGRVAKCGLPPDRVSYIHSDVTVRSLHYGASHFLHTVGAPCERFVNAHQWLTENSKLTDPHKAWCTPTHERAAMQEAQDLERADVNPAAAGEGRAGAVAPAEGPPAVAGRAAALEAEQCAFCLEPLTCNSVVLQCGHVHHSHCTVQFLFCESGGWTGGLVGGPVASEHSPAWDPPLRAAMHWCYLSLQPPAPMEGGCPAARGNCCSSFANRPPTHPPTLQTNGSAPAAGPRSTSPGSRWLPPAPTAGCGSSPPQPHPQILASSRGRRHSNSSSSSRECPPASGS